MSDEKSPDLNEEDDPLEKLLKGEKITEVVSTRRGDFEIVFPTAADLREIEMDVANMLGGHPIADFERERVGQFRVYATLRKVIKKAPAWWNKLAHPEQCPDENLITELYRRYLRLYEATQGALGKGTYRGPVGEVQQGGGAS